MQTSEPKHTQDLSKHAFSSALWMFSSSGLQAVLRIAFNAVLARLLSPSDFGVVAIATMVTGFAELLVQMGVGPALVQTKEITDDHINTGFTFSILSGFFMAFVFWIINPYIAAFFEMPALTSILNILLWIFPLRMVTKISNSIIQRELLFKKLAGVDVVSYLFGYGLVGITLAYLGYGFTALIWATLMQALIYSALMFYMQPHSLKLNINFKLLKPLLSYGSNFTLANFFSFMALQADFFVVGKLMGSTALGFYNRAYNLMNNSTNIIGTVMNTVLFASFSKLQDDRTRQERSLIKSYNLLFLFFLPISLFVVILAPELVNMLLGSKWTAIILPFQILAGSMVFRIGYKVGSTFAKGMGAAKSNAQIQFIYFLSVVAGAVIGVYAGGILYVAISVSLAIVLNFILSVFLVIKLSDFNWSSFGKTIYNGLVFTVITLVLDVVAASVFRVTINQVLVTFFGTMFLNFLVTLLILRFRPALIGNDGLWVINQLVNKLPKKIKSRIKGLAPVLKKMTDENKLKKGRKQNVATTTQPGV